MSALSLSFTRWTLAPIAMVALASGCGSLTGSKPSVVDVPDDGLYAGSIHIEKKSYAAGIRVDTRSCSAPMLLEVDVAAEDWFEMVDASCDLAGLEGVASVRLVPAPGSTATGSPMGLIEGSVPEMTWTGSFWSDGEFEASAATTVDGFGTSAEWTITISALSASAAFDTGDSGM